MSATSVIIRYANAIYQIASDRDRIDEVSKDLFQIEMISGSSQTIKDYCISLHPKRKEEMIFINTAFIPHVSGLTANLLRTAVRNGRLGILPYLSAAFEKIKDRALGVTELTIQSAFDMEESTVKVIKEKMEKRIEQKLRFKTENWPPLTGGFRILWDDRMLDMSVCGRIKRMRALIKAR